MNYFIRKCCLFIFWFTLFPWFGLCNIPQSQCPSGYFILKDMKFCYPWLNCNDIENIARHEKIGFGLVKDIFRGKWKSHNVTINLLSSPLYEKDFEFGLNMFKSLSPSPYLTQLVGFCDKKHIFITEYYKHNNAHNVLNVFAKAYMLNACRRLKLCINYAEILNFLHRSPIGTRVNCDSNDLFKLLTQLLLTDQYKLVLNDLDALPHVKENTTITCGSRPINTTFAAPEQRVGQNFKNFPPSYDEKSDIWKAASLCEHFIGHEHVIRYFVFDLHAKCKEINPLERPTASYMIYKYKEVFEELCS